MYPPMNPSLTTHAPSCKTADNQIFKEFSDICSKRLDSPWLSKQTWSQFTKVQTKPHPTNTNINTNTNFRKYSSSP
jgi:hypothetical protein